MILLENILLYLIIFIAEAIICYYYINRIFSAKVSNVLQIIVISIGYGILYLCSFIDFFPLNGTAFILINFIIMQVLCTAKWSSCLFHSMILTCIMSLCEVIVFTIFSQFNQTSYYTGTDITLLIFLALLSKSLYFTCVSILIRWIRPSNKQPEYTSRVTRLLNVISFILLYTVIALMAFLLTSAPSIALRYVLLASSILLFALNFFIIYIYHYTQRKTAEFVELQIQLQREYDMTEYYKTLFTQNKNQRILIHDIRNHLTSIARLNEQNDHEKIRQYLNSLLNSPALQNSAYVSDNEMLNSILCHYIKLCQDKQIQFKVDIRKKLLKNLDYTELTSLFCNLLDNAITSCKNMPDPFIELNVLLKENSSLTLIKIINSCDTEPHFDTNGFPVSSKEDIQNHGLGMKSVNRIINNYNGTIKMYYDSSQKAFHTIILLNNA